MKSCIIIGAGMAGLIAARELTNNGWEVTILEKGRGVGGRMATRRINNTRADHGAQYFSVRTPEFRQLIERLEAEGVAKAWDLSEAGIEHLRYIGAKGMSTLPKYLAQGLNVRLQERATLIEGDATGCRVTTEGGGTFSAEALILTIPSPQAVTLLRDSTLALPEFDRIALENITYQPCLAVIALLNQPSEIPLPGLQVLEKNGVEKVIDNQQKGIAPEQPTVTIHATPAFSNEHLEGDLREAGQKLLDQLTDWIPATSVAEYQVHRWRYSLAEVRHPDAYLRCPTPFAMLLGGDGFGLGNVEGAFQSGLQMAQALEGRRRKGTE